MDNLPRIAPRRRNIAGAARPAIVPVLARAGAQRVVDGAHVGERPANVGEQDLMDFVPAAPDVAARVHGAQAAAPGEARGRVGMVTAVRYALFAGAGLGVVAGSQVPEEWKLFTYGIAVAIGAMTLPQPWDSRAAFFATLGVHTLEHPGALSDVSGSVVGLYVGAFVVILGCHFALARMRAREAEWVVVANPDHHDRIEGGDDGIDDGLQEALDRVPADVRAFLADPREFEDIDDFDPLDDASVLAKPYDSVLTLPFTNADEPSVHRQLRFFATLEGPAKPFEVFAGGRLVRAYKPSERFTRGTMKAFMAETFMNPETLFVMRFDDRIKAVVHGEDFCDSRGNIGAWLNHISGEFTAALMQADERRSSEPDAKTLRALCAVIRGWCLDGSTTMLNQFLRENNMAGIDLSLVPNLDGKTSNMAKMHEYVRVFRLRREKDFEAAEGIPARDSHGTPCEAFLQRYGDMRSFRTYLKDQKAFFDVPKDDVRNMLVQLVDSDLLPAFDEVDEADEVGRPDEFDKADDPSRAHGAWPERRAP